MGKAARWFRSLLGLKKPENVTMTTPNTDAKLTPNRRWSFSKSKSTTNRYNITSPSIISALPRFQLKDGDDQQHAAAEVEWLCSRNTNELNGNENTVGYVKKSCNRNRDYWFAVKIQSHFRAYLVCFLIYSNVCTLYNNVHCMFFVYNDRMLIFIFSPSTGFTRVKTKLETVQSRSKKLKYLVNLPAQLKPLKMRLIQWSCFSTELPGIVFHVFTKTLVICLALLARAVMRFRGLSRNQFRRTYCT